MTHDEIVQFVDDLYGATGAGDWDKANSMLTEDLVITEAAGLPMAGTYKGQNALQELFNDVFATLDVAGLERVETVTGGDYAVTILTMKFAGDGLKDAELCEMFRFRDGKCCEIKPYYFDPAPVLAAAKRKQEASA